MHNSEKTFKRAILSAAVVATCIPSWVIAADAKDENLEEVTVTGSLLGESLPEEVTLYPGNRSVLSAEQLRKSASLSLDGALQQVPGVKVQDETGTGVLPNVAVRGMNASRSGYTQFLLDGVPLTLAPYGHTGQSLFPTALKSIERIDIVRGGAAVQYGPNNVAGVINLVSKPVPQEYETSLEEKVTTFSGGNTLTDTYVRTGGNLTDSFALQMEGNVIAGDSFRDHSDTRVENWVLKSRWDIAEHKRLDLNIQHYDADTEMPGALTTAAYQQNRDQSQRPNDRFLGDTKRLSARYNQQFDLAGTVGEFDWTSFAHKSRRNFQWDFSTAPSADHWADPDAPATHLRSSPRKFLVWGTEPRASVLLQGDNSEHKVTIGSRFVRENIGYRLEQLDLASDLLAVPRDWILDTSAAAFYLSDEFRLSQTGLTVTPGLRYEQVDMRFTDANAGTATDNTVKELLPGLTVGYESSENLFVYANSQRSLRAPQIAVIRGTGEEGAELSWNYEIGARFHASTGTSISASTYRIDFEDQLLYNSSLQSFDNIGETRHQGIELEGRYTPAALPELKLHLGYNYLDSEQMQGANKGKELPYSSRHQLVWDADYSFAIADVTLSGFYYSSAYSDAANTATESASGTTGKLPSFVVWNLQVSKTFDQENGNALYTGLSLNNLLDREYYFRGIDVSPSGRYPAPPRSAAVEVKYTF
ncbi:TonB-dependent receptor family protein [Microbulbifer aggregans]|uniref:TonB-dependent receptor family protein n=1 Tax=Microbulbifer aggregans TaxID=1769779 RepID=UPI001CFCD3BB|nr:TonB-dependent siderophore receptor [Microbulbifer aggregans]